MSIAAERRAQAIAFLDESVEIPAYARDLQGFRRWAHSDEFPQRGKVSYLGGSIEVDMCPQEIETHIQAKGAIFGDLREWVRSRDSGDVYEDGTLVTNEDADLSTEPDVTFCTWATLQSGRVTYTEWSEESERYIELAGSPDLVVEVVSNSSVRKDTVRLPPRYFAADIPEYWIVDARGSDIKFRVLTRGESEYQDVPADAEGWLNSPVLGTSVRLLRERNRVGRWRYTLELR
jgi:Uma2 family endonuclease